MNTPVVAQRPQQNEFLRKIAEILEPRPDCRYYVDIGCYHPHEISNTHVFDSLGWRGLAVDMREQAIFDVAMKRPLCATARYAVVGEGRPECEAAYDCGVLSSLVRAMEGKPDNKFVLKRKASIAYPVPTITPQALFAKHTVPRTIGFVNIDTEGVDAEIFEAFPDDRTYLAAVIETNESFYPGQQLRRIMATAERLGMFPVGENGEDVFLVHGSLLEAYKSVT